MAGGRRFSARYIAHRQPYRQIICDYQPNDLYILLSDGVVEAHNSQAEMLSFTGVDQFLADAPTDSAEDLTQYLSQHVLDFQRDVPQHDDVTVVTVQVVVAKHDASAGNS